MFGDHAKAAREFLLVSDFDQTLSFNDSGFVLSELLGVDGFHERIAGLANIHLVQQGGELAYLILHDPEYRRVRKEHLVEAGKRIRLKAKGTCPSKTRPGHRAGKTRSVRWSGYVKQQVRIRSCGSRRSCTTSTTWKRCAGPTSA